MIRINLLPPEYKPQPSVRPIRLLLLFLLIVLPLGLVGGVFFGLTTLQSLRQEIDATNEKIAEYGPVYQEVLRLEAAVAELDKKMDARRRLMAGLLDAAWALRSMEEVVPHNVAYSSFRVGQDGSVTVNGASLDYYGVAALQLKLMLDPRCANVILQNANQAGATVGFNMSFALRKEAQTP